MRLCFVLLQLFFFAVQKARCRGTEYGCITSFTCLARKLCPSMIYMERILNAKAEACGRGKVCCPPVSPDENVKDENIPKEEKEKDENIPEPEIVKDENIPEVENEKDENIPKEENEKDENIPEVENGKDENVPEVENKETCGLERIIQSAPGHSYDGKYPWMVALLHKGNHSYHCTGFLVDRRHVITSARCLKWRDPEDFYASIGSADYDEGRLYNIARFLKHGDYEPYFYPTSLSGVLWMIHHNNIGLLSLSEEVEFSDFNPICLPPKTLGDLEGHRGTFVGWGLDSLDYQEKHVRIMSKAECDTKFQEVYDQDRGGVGFTNQEFCTDPKGLEIDGLLMMKIGERWTAVGISSKELRRKKNQTPGEFPSSSVCKHRQLMRIPHKIIYSRHKNKSHNRHLWKKFKAFFLF